MMPSERSQHYLNILLTPCYKPSFGTADKEGINYSQFFELFSADPLYQWLNLASPKLYAAHKASGGITSFYRQLGIGCERLIREILKDTLGLNEEQVNWGYTYQNATGTVAKMSLDARICCDDCPQPAQERLRLWIQAQADSLQIEPKIATSLQGVVFEVRQGYKSADSKRQNADLANALRAYQAGYLPVIFLLSNQINTVVQTRYLAANLTILCGVLSEDVYTSSYAFMEKVVGYALHQFFAQNSMELQREVEKILNTLLDPV